VFKNVARLPTHSVLGKASRVYSRGIAKQFSKAHLLQTSGEALGRDSSGVRRKPAQNDTEASSPWRK
jgi:hypothetical protein